MLLSMTQADAAKIREARRARVRMIRARVIGGSVALFMVVWSLITVVLVTGHDPALASQKSSTAAAQTTTTSGSSGSGSGSTNTTGAATTGTTTTGSANSTGSTSSGATSSSTGSASSSVSPVTSSQS
jgi:hypothetical protein